MAVLGAASRLDLAVSTFLRSKRLCPVLEADRPLAARLEVRFRCRAVGPRVKGRSRLGAASQLSSSNDGSCSKLKSAGSLWEWLVDFGTRRPADSCFNVRFLAWRAGASDPKETTTGVNLTPQSGRSLHRAS